ncbi:MAG: proline iminopeptidase-family hydrolase [Cyclobacteriaceae bacterium]
MKNFYLILGLLVLISFACTPAETADTAENPTSTGTSYFDNSGRDDVLSGGIKMVPVNTPSGEFKVWTKRVGNNPDMKVLILHGGPGMTHELYECFDSYFPAANIEYYYYDQLGSHYSDQPEDSSLWETARFVEEVEQVRQALGLEKDNFYLYGHSWGGILAMEYALKYQENLKGLIISNMMASCPEYGQYAKEVLAKRMPVEVVEEIYALEAKEDFSNPRYMELLLNHHYVQHVLRMPVEEWPDPVNRGLAHVNPDVYVSMQGPSEFGIRGKLEKWDRKADLPKISIPTLVIGAEFDTMDPEHMRWMAGEVQQGRYLHCPQGSHLAMYDDQQVYFDGIIKFVKDAHSGNLKKGG